MNPVGIFWDYENCHPPSFMSGYTVVERIRKTVQPLGSISVFKAYFDVNREASKGIQQHELQSSGVSLIHTPHSSSKKDVADKVLLVDLLVFALEGQGKKTLVLITGDQDFTYAVSILRMRGHDVFIISPPRATHRSLECLANGILDWRADILMLVDEPVRKPSFSGQGGFPPDLIRTESSMPPTALASAKTVSRVSLHTLAAEDRTDMQGVEDDDTTSGGYAGALADSTHEIHESAMLENNDTVPPQDVFTAQAAYADLDDYTLVSCLEEDIGSAWPTQEDKLNTCDKRSSSLSDTKSEATRVDQDDDDEEAGEDAGKRPALPEIMSRIPSPFAEVVSGEAPPSAFITESSHAVPLAGLSSSAVDMFSDLIEVLEGERSLGRLSTTCSSLEPLLLEANPWVFKTAGVSGLREYLEAAQHANIVFFTGIDWETKAGYVFLRAQATQSGYAGRGFQSPDRFEASTQIPHNPLSGIVHPSEQETPSAPPTHSYNKPIDPIFRVLIDELRALRMLGQFTIRRGSLSPKLRKRDPLVYARLGLSKPKGYIRRAENMGIVLLEHGGKKGKTVSVSLHPDYY